MQNEQVVGPGRCNQNKKAKAPRKHHYVPVFYQSGFMNSNGLLWVYDRKQKTYKELHPRVICFERDLYTLKPDNDQPHDMRIETMVLNLVDGLGSWGIQGFQAGQPDKEVEEAVAFFMAFQWTRLPTFSRDTRLTFAKSAEEVSRFAFANVDRVKALMRENPELGEEHPQVTAESLVEFVASKRYEIVATEVAFFDNMVHQAVALSKLFVQLDWELLIAAEDTGFILCDSPVTVVPPKGINAVGFLIPGTTKYFPLTQRLCVRLGDRGCERGVRRVGREDVRTINQNIAANSERFVMGTCLVQLQNIISRSKCAEMEGIPRVTIETIKVDENESLQKVSAVPRRYFYRKNGEPLAP